MGFGFGKEQRYERNKNRKHEYELYEERHECVYVLLRHVMF